MYSLLDDNGSGILILLGDTDSIIITVYLVVMEVSYNCLLGDDGGVILLSTW